MKKLNQLSAIAKVFAVTLLLLTAQQSLKSQITPVPLSGSIYGEPIIGACYHNGLRYVTTASSIYSGGGNQNNYYRKVWSAPTGFSIAGSNVVHYYTGDFHTILLRDAGSSSYVSLSKINTSGPDDNGSNPVPLPSFFAPFVKIAGNANALYALTHQVTCGIQGNLYVSHDQGQTWNQDTAGVEWGNVYDFALDTAGNLYTISDMGFNKQLAGDSTATQVNFTTNSVFLSNLFIDRHNRIIIGANSITYSPTDAAYISTDGGNTFTTNATLSGNFNAYTDDAFGNLYAMGTDSVGEAMLVCINAAGTGAVVNSNLNSVIPASAQFSVNSSDQFNCFNGDSILLIGTKLGLFSSADQGNTWTATNQGIFAENIYSIITQPFGRLLCSTDIGVFYKDDADTLWHQTNMADGTSPGTYLYNDNAGNIFVQKADGYTPPSALAKSTDNGFSWSVENAGFNNIRGGSFYLDEAGAQHFYSTYEVSSHPLTIWTQNPGDSTWTVDTSGFPFVQNELAAVNTVCSDRQGYLYADLNVPPGINLMFRRALNASQWNIDTAGLSTGQNITAMASNPSYGAIAVSGGSGMDYVSTLFHRTDSGWVKIPTRKDSVNITAVSVDANGVIFAAERGPQSDTINIPQTNAVYYTSDNGNTWSQAFLTNMNVFGTTSNFISASVPGGLISNANITYALTKGHGGFVFTTQKTTTGINVKTEMLGNDIQAFPNPSSTGVWTLQAGNEMAGSNVELSDMNGRIVYRAVLTSSESEIISPELAKGAYILNVRNVNKSASAVLVKQ